MIKMKTHIIRISNSCHINHIEIKHANFRCLFPSIRYPAGVRLVLI